MKKYLLAMTIAATTTSVLFSCGSSRSGVSGADAGMKVEARGISINNYDLVPIGERIVFTIDISTPEGLKKLNGLSLDEAQRLVMLEASRKYNCDRLIDPRFDYLKDGDQILRITVDGRPGNYKTRR